MIAELLYCLLVHVDCNLSACSRTVDLVSSNPAFDGAMTHLASIPKFKYFGFQTMFTAVVSGQILEFLPSAMAGDLSTRSDSASPDPASLEHTSLTRIIN